MVKAEKDDSMMLAAFSINLLPKVLVIRDQNAALVEGLADDIVVCHPTSLFIY